MHPMNFRNHIWNQEKKLNPMSTKSQFPKFFLGMVYTLDTAPLKVYLGYEKAQSNLATILDDHVVKNDLLSRNNHER